MKFSGIEPIIGLLAAIGWWIVKAIYDRRRDAEMWEEAEETPPARPMPPRAPMPPRVPTPPPPFVLRPQQIPKPPPPPIRPVLIMDEQEGPARRDIPQLKQPHESHSRASHLQQTVADRLHAIDLQTTAAKPAAPPKRTRPFASADIVRTFRNPATVRQAFLAQFVLNPPKALE